MIKKPSFISMIFNGLLILYVLYLLVINWNKYNQESVQFIILIILLSIMIGIHGLLHLGLEKNYNYNPLETGIWI